jgi:hypothetical protein
MGLFDIANSSKVSAEDKPAMDEADAKEEARYKSGPDEAFLKRRREDMARKRKLDAMRKKRDKEEQPSHRGNQNLQKVQKVLPNHRKVPWMIF